MQRAVDRHLGTDNWVILFNEETFPALLRHELNKFGLKELSRHLP